MSVYLGTINESTTGRYTATMYDETGTVIDGTAMSTLTLTLYDKRSGTIVNSRINQDVSGRQRCGRDQRRRADVDDCQGRHGDGGDWPD